MPLVPQTHESVSSNVKFDDFWENKNLHFSVTDKTRILSYATKIPPINPLAFIQKFAGVDTKHFYWENPRRQEAVAACGITKSQTIASERRFDLAQNFVDECFQQIVRKNNLAEAKPCVFCNFTFFPESSQKDFSVSVLFLPRFQLIKKNKTYYLIVNYPLRNSERETLIVKQIEQKINSINWSNIKLAIDDNNSVQNTIERHEIESPQHFKSVVTSALKAIERGDFSKVVIAHATELRSSVPFQLSKTLSNLREKHPECYIFSISNGKGQNFIGASPERSISIQNKQLVTDALAGSISRGKTSTEDLHLANLLLKNRKEKREHQAVSEFIMQRLRQLNLKPQQLPLQILKLSNIQHLWTPIYAHLSYDIKPLTIVAHLHPTPAVAGEPTTVACEKIRQYEECDRSLYAAPLGWVDAEDNCEFVVGIRSALIDGNRAKLYAGAGIVSGSEPDKEFAEVQLKLRSAIEALVQS